MKLKLIVYIFYLFSLGCASTQEKASNYCKSNPSVNVDRCINNRASYLNKIDDVRHRFNEDYMECRPKVKQDNCSLFLTSLSPNEMDDVNTLMSGFAGTYTDNSNQVSSSKEYFEVIELDFTYSELGFTNTRSNYNERVCRSVVSPGGFVDLPGDVEKTFREKCMKKRGWFSPTDTDFEIEKIKKEYGY